MFVSLVFSCVLFSCVLFSSAAPFSISFGVPVTISGVMLAIGWDRSNGFGSDLAVDLGTKRDAFETTNTSCLDKERFNDVHCGDGAFDWCSTGRLIIISAAVLGLFFVSTAVLCVKMSR